MRFSYIFYFNCSCTLLPLIAIYVSIDVINHMQKCMINPWNNTWMGSIGLWTTFTMIVQISQPVHFDIVHLNHLQYDVTYIKKHHMWAPCAYGYTFTSIFIYVCSWWSLSLGTFLAIWVLKQNVWLSRSLAGHWYMIIYATRHLVPISGTPSLSYYLAKQCL